MTETQQISLLVIEAMPQADREKIFEETLCMVSTVSSRAAASALGPGDPSKPHLAEALLSLPLTLHAYVAGREIISSKAENPDSDRHDTSAIERMLSFYGTHVQDGGCPDRKTLRHVMILWMGRISTPGLHEHPEQRLERLALIDRLTDHTRLIEAFARNADRTR